MKDFDPYSSPWDDGRIVMEGSVERYVRGAGS